MTALTRQDAAVDASTAAFLESTEMAMAEAYRLLVGRGVLSDGAVAIAERFRAHHLAHAEALAAVAGAQAAGGANVTLLAEFEQQVLAVDSEGAAMRFARSMETRATDSCAAALARVASEPVVDAAASIVPVESAHAAILAVVIGLGLDETLPDGTSVEAPVGFDPGAYPVR